MQLLGYKIMSAFFLKVMPSLYVNDKNSFSFIAESAPFNTSRFMCDRLQ